MIDQRHLAIARQLAQLYPGSTAELCELNFDSPFQLLVATVLSAQCTDKTVNEVTVDLFRRFGEPEQLMAADERSVEQVIRRTGFFRVKTQHIIGLSRQICENFDGQVPTELKDLVTLPGVGRKTANVVRSVAFGLPGLPVDTHVIRLSNRLGLSTTKDPVRLEHELCDWVSPSETGVFSLRLIHHGRKVCRARRPACGECALTALCTAAFRSLPGGGSSTDLT